MKFKVGDIIKPKEPEGIDAWYNIKYKIVAIRDENSNYPEVEMEVLIDDETAKRIEEDAKHDIDVDFEGYPDWVTYEVKVKVNRYVIDYVFNENEWVKVM